MQSHFQYKKKKNKDVLYILKNIMVCDMVSLAICNVLHLRK